MVIDDEIYSNKFSLQSIEFIKMIKYLQDITKRLNVTIKVWVNAEQQLTCLSCSYFDNDQGS